MSEEASSTNILISEEAASANILYLKSIHFGWQMKILVKILTVLKKSYLTKVMNMMKKAI